MLESEFKLLAAFLHEPSKELYGRQIERIVGTTHERTTVYLKSLVGTKMLLREKKGNQVFYRLNKRNELVQKIMAFAELEKKREFIKKNDYGYIVHAVVSEATEEFRTAIYFVLLFGSVARSQQRESSDIDLLFVLVENGKTKDSIEKIVKKHEMITGKKISYHPIILKELEKEWKKKAIYKNIWDERIVFFGEDNFWNFIMKMGEPHDG